MTNVLRLVALPSLRLLLGLVFIWFGMLKLVGSSPVADLVARTLPWLPRHLVVPALGGVEIVLGLAVVLGIGLRIVIPILCAHLMGTFLTFAVVPTLMFQDHNPLLLTTDGEFVMKNLVLIAAALLLLTETRGTRHQGSMVANLGGRHSQ